MRVHINATRCAAYLRSVGIEVSPELAASWAADERDYRDRNRAANRELKKSCGHFRTHMTRVVSDEGDQLVRVCSDCRQYLTATPYPRPPRGGGEPLPISRIA